MKIPEEAGAAPVPVDEAQKILEDPFRKWKSLGYRVSLGVRDGMYTLFEIAATEDGVLRIGMESGGTNTFFLFRMDPPIDDIYGPIERCFKFRSKGIDKVVVFEALQEEQKLYAFAYLADAHPTNLKLGSLRGGANAHLREKLCIPGAFSNSPRVEDFLVDAGVKPYLIWGLRLEDLPIREKESTAK